MKKALTFIAISIVCSTWLHAQTITGTFPQLAKQTVQLKGFDGFRDFEISSTTIDSVGHFKLKYQTTDLQKWEGQAVKDYQVYATPSYFMLHKDLKIVGKYSSLEGVLRD